MRVIKAVELNDEEVLAIEDTIRIVEKLADTLLQNDAPPEIFGWLMVKFYKSGTRSLPNVLQLEEDEE